MIKISVKDGIMELKGSKGLLKAELTILLNRMLSEGVISESELQDAIKKAKMTREEMEKEILSGNGIVSKIGEQYIKALKDGNLEAAKAIENMIDDMMAVVEGWKK